MRYDRDGNILKEREDFAGLGGGPENTSIGRQWRNKVGLLSAWVSEARSKSVDPAIELIKVRLTLS
jgi:hypothetical protein